VIHVFSVDGRQPLLGSVVVVMSLPFDHTLKLVPSLFGWKSRNVEQSTQQPLRRDIDSTTIYLTCRYIKSNGGTRIPSPTLREHVRKAQPWRSVLRDVARSSQPESESDPRVAPRLSSAAQGSCQSAMGLLISPVEHQDEFGLIGGRLPLEKARQEIKWKLPLVDHAS
jgi:hypothetical protein